VRSVECQRRRIRVRPLGGYARLLDSSGWVWILAPSASHGQPRELRCKIEEIRVDADERVLTLTPGVPRDTIALMKGAAVFVVAEELADSEMGLADLEGLRVVDGEGAPVGVVAAVYPSLSGGAFEVKREDGSTFVVPAIEQVIEEVDIDCGIVVIGDIAPYVVEDED